MTQEQLREAAVFSLIAKELIGVGEMFFSDRAGNKYSVAHLMADFATSEAAREYWEGQGWMRVEGEYKLPHIGEWVLLFNGHWTGVGKRNRIEFGDNEETMWEDETSEYITPYPTHWRPLPAPPNQ